ncbi:DUF5050 domain-containing protein [Paenibacillus filicis]|uniref:DUF5050 domain-containing protein n=1 Tax=Paenibacillus filicis TaxID=669464 RepID=A0ABU9DX12_9BACL
MTGASLSLNPDASAQEAKASFPAFPVAVNGVFTDQRHSEYPALLYREMIYFPMTWHYASALGLTVDWSEQDGLSVASSSGCNPLIQDLTAEGNLDGAGDATLTLAPFPIKVNGKSIINQEEPYPVLLYRNIVYFPMTWSFTREAFGWTTSWDDKRGFGIRSCAEPSSATQTHQDRLNIASGGQLAVKDGWVYQNPLALIKSRPDGSEQTQLSDDQALSINVVGDWLYYIAFDNWKKNSIYKMRTDGSDRTLVSDKDARHLWVQGDWIYDMADGLNRRRTDGTDEQKLLDDKDLREYFLSNDRLYVLKGEDGQRGLYVMNLDGSEARKLHDGVTSFILIDDWIYYVSQDKQLYKMNADGSVHILLHETTRPPLGKMNYRDGWLYYVSGGFGIAGSASVERIRIDGSAREALFEARATALYIAGDEIYFPHWDMGDRTLYHTKLP